MKKNLLKVECVACKEPATIYKYAKTEVSCHTCTSLLSVPRANKCKVLARYYSTKTEPSLQLGRPLEG